VVFTTVRSYEETGCGLSANRVAAPTCWQVELQLTYASKNDAGATCEHAVQRSHTSSHSLHPATRSSAVLPRHAQESTASSQQEAAELLLQLLEQQQVLLAALQGAVDSASSADLLLQAFQGQVGHCCMQRSVAAAHAAMLCVPCIEKVEVRIYCCDAC
jgi:hypothetical protein